MNARHAPPRVARPSRRRRGWPVAVAAAMVVSACGGSAGSNGGTSTQTTTGGSGSSSGAQSAETGPATTGPATTGPDHGATTAGSTPTSSGGADETAALGLVGMDHAGLTVPDVAAAATWFVDVMGCVAPLSFGPFSDPDPNGTFMTDLVDVDRSAVIDQITMVRCGDSANVELFQYTAPDQKTEFPRNSDYAGSHVAFYVTDLTAATEYLVAKGVEKFDGPLAVEEGPAAGQSINYFKTSFGSYIELISYPDGMAYQADVETPLWSPKLNTSISDATGVPGLLGVDHVGITVPDIDEAAAWFADMLGCSSPLAFGPFSDSEGTFMQDYLDVNPRAVIDKIQHMRCGDGPSVELFQYSSPDQDQEFRLNSDVGGHHVAFYVTDIESAVATLTSRGAEKLMGPLPVEEGPAAGQSINYFKTPFGTYVELISYPDGMAYEADAAAPLWNPNDNKS